MKRWHEERSLMLRRWAIEKGKHHPGWGRFKNSEREGDECHCLRGPGFLRKRTPYDCGTPRCPLCHFEKLYVSKARATKRRAAIEFELTGSGLEPRLVASCERGKGVQGGRGTRPPKATRCRAGPASGAE